MLEAVATGLFVISTDVDEVSEVLPDVMIYMVDPSVAGLVISISGAIQNRIVVEDRYDYNQNY